MNKLLALATACLLSAASFAQDATFRAVKAAIQEKYPSLSLENRLLAINVWSADDHNSREANKSFDKTASIYRVAKLRGGEAGLVGVSVNLKDAVPVAVATLKQDGITTILPLESAGLAGLLENGPSNIVYDSSGREIFRNLPSTEVFNSILGLIKR